MPDVYVFVVENPEDEVNRRQVEHAIPEERPLHDVERPDKAYAPRYDGRAKDSSTLFDFIGFIAHCGNTELTLINFIIEFTE